MGNNPSTPTTGHQPSSSKPQTPAPAESSATSPRTLRNPHRSPISIGHTSHALAAPPEPSNAYAHGRSVPTRAGFSHLQQHHQQYQQHQQQQSHHSHNPHQPAQGSGSGASPSQSPNLAQGVTGSAGPAPKTVPVSIPDATRPVDVPPHAVDAEFAAQHIINRDDPLASDVNSIMMANNSISDLSYLTRPPRLPLPIEEDLKTPGSPMSGPTEVSEIIDDEGDILAAKHAAAVEGDGAAREDQMTRKASGATADTADDDMAGDWDGDDAAGNRATVPTRLEWLGGGDKVWVTGTIFQWKRKHRLHPIEGRPGCFADTINVVTGTHHIRFLVDGVMTTSEHMPTTVDLANNLVNYMVVSVDDADKKAREDAAAEARRDSTAESDDQEAAKRPKTRPVHPSHLYLNPIPQYLADFDQPEESPAYQYAVRAMEKLPPPPGLPGFLAKPILNAPTLVREDNSVLILPPNHTVLNHLATCSIKNNILSVSATTRYRAKYVTSIIYKPSTMDE